MSANEIIEESKRKSKYGNVGNLPTKQSKPLNKQSMVIAKTLHAINPINTIASVNANRRIEEKLLRFFGCFS